MIYMMYSKLSSLQPIPGLCGAADVVLAHLDDATLQERYMDDELMN